LDLSGRGCREEKRETLGQSLDNYVMIPITAYLKAVWRAQRQYRISGKAAAAGVSLNEAVDEARVALRAHRHDRAGEEDTFDIETNASLLSIWKASAARSSWLRLAWLRLRLWWAASLS